MKKFHIVLPLIILFALHYSFNSCDAQVTCDKFSIIAKLSNHKMTIGIDTDLPDQTKIMVSVGRSYWETVDPEEYSERYFSVKDTVGKWRTPKVIDVRDAIWQKALASRQALCARAGIPFRVGRTDEMVEISFTVPIGQDDPRFGRGNSKLRGKMLEKSTSRINTITIDQRFYLPLGTPLERLNKKVPVHAYNLTIGEKYVLSRRTPLGPARTATQLESLELFVNLLPDAEILVIERDDTGMYPWYQVEANDAGIKRDTTGWINSVALVGQDVWEVETEVKSDKQERIQKLETEIQELVKQKNQLDQKAIRLRLELRKLQEELEKSESPTSEPQ